MSGLKPGCVVYRGGAHNDLDMAAFDQVGKTLVVSMAFQWRFNGTHTLQITWKVLIPQNLKCVS
jgi:hypothetical protein